MQRAVLLAGDHPTLPQAELRALLAVHDPQALVEVEGLLAIVTPRHPEAVDAALSRMAMLTEWGVLWGDGDGSEGGLVKLEHGIQTCSDGRGSAGIQLTRKGAKKNPEALSIQRRLGNALAARGHVIRLDSPDRPVFLWCVDERLLVVDRKGPPPGDSPYEARHMEERDHFQPVGLHPRRAACLLHLAQVTPGGRVMDPFCGTGGLLLEAALEGYDVVGSDLDAWMVQGSLQTLADAGPEPLAGTVFVADIATVPDLVEAVDGIVCDFPYGRASSSDGEDLRLLYDRAFATFSRLLTSGGRAVVGHADSSLLPNLAQHGFVLEALHEEFVHKSLTRRFAVVIKQGPVGGAA